MTACIAFENLADDATVVASTQEILLPANNLQIVHVARKWRSLLPDAYVVFTLSSADDINTIAAFGINAETVRVRASLTDSAGATGEVYDSGWQTVSSAYASFVGLMAGAASALYVRIDLSTTSADFVEMGRVFIGARTQFSINFQFGWERGRVDRSIRTKTRGGQTQVSQDTIVRTVNVTFGYLSESESTGLLETIDRVAGLQSDVLLILDPSSTNLPRDSYWGLIQDNTPVVNPSFGIFSKVYKIEERL